MKNLRIARKALNLTQEALGKKINVKKSAISKYENGTIEPSQNILIRLAKVLNVSIDYLLGLDSPPKTNEFVLSNPERVLIERFRSSSKEIQRAILRILNINNSPTKEKTIGEDIAEIFQKETVYKN